MRILGRTVAVLGVLMVTACALVSGGVVPVDDAPAGEVNTPPDTPAAADDVLPSAGQATGLASGTSTSREPG